MLAGNDPESSSQEVPHLEKRLLGSQELEIYRKAQGTAVKGTAGKEALRNISLNFQISCTLPR